MNISCLGLVARRVQLIEEKYKFRLPQFETKGGSLDAESDSALFLGLGAHSNHGRLAVCVMPALAEYIGEELAKEAAITKGRVKAHELRQQVRNLSKASGPKGGSGGSG